MDKQAEEKLAHSQPSSKNKIIKCDQCEETFQHNDWLKYQIVDIHEVLLTCEECNHTCKSKEEIIDHTRQHVIPQLDGHNKYENKKKGTQ